MDFDDNHDEDDDDDNVEDDYNKDDYNVDDDIEACRLIAVNIWNIKMRMSNAH